MAATEARLRRLVPVVGLGDVVKRHGIEISLRTSGFESDQVCLSEAVTLELLMSRRDL